VLDRAYAANPQRFARPPTRPGCPPSPGSTSPPGGAHTNKLTARCLTGLDSFRLRGAADRLHTLQRRPGARGEPRQPGDSHPGLGASHGHGILQVISEPAGTRGTTTKRDGSADVLNAWRTARGDGIVVRELERPSRDVFVHEQLVRDVRGQDKEVLSTAPSEADLRDDPEDPTRRLIASSSGRSTPTPRDMTVLRMQRGKRRKQQRGGYLGGTAPLRLPPGGQGADPRPGRAGPSQTRRPWHPTTVARVLRRIP
jgi:hypothetical protein